VTHEGALGSLKRYTADVRVVREGFECGIGIEGYNHIRAGDVIAAYEIEQVARTL
jgi:translation initiation factor IF-2